MTATSLDLSQIKTDALSAASTFRTLIGLGSGDTPTFKGATLSTGTITANTPAVDIGQTWNNSGVTFTGILANVTDTASNAASLLMDLQVGGSSKFSVSKTGSLAIPISQIIKFGSTDPASIFQGFNASLYIGGSTTATTWAAFDANGIYIRSNAAFRWSTSATDPYATQLALFADAADTLAQRRTTNAQTFRIYNTYTNANNYERAKIAWSSNVLQIGTEKLGTGAARALELQTDGTTRLTIGTAGLFTIADALDIAVGTTTGTKIGTSTSQKIGFYNATPVVQPTAVADATDAASVITQLNALLSRMRNLGLIAT
jgi:hypothetical protein